MDLTAKTEPVVDAAILADVARIEAEITLRQAQMVVSGTDSLAIGFALRDLSPLGR